MSAWSKSMMTCTMKRLKPLLHISWLLCYTNYSTGEGVVFISLKEFEDCNYMYVTDPYLVEWLYIECWKHPFITVDVETTERREFRDLNYNRNIFKPGLDPYMSEIRLLQIGLPDCVYVIDCWACPNVVIFGDIMASHEVLKIGFNFKFDMKMMMRQWGFRFRRIYDCMLVDRLLFNGMHEYKKHYKLSDVTQRFLGVTLDKSQQTSDWGAEVLSEEQIRYAAIDVAILIPLAEAQKKRLRNMSPNAKIRYDLVRTAKIEFDACIAVAKIELNGLYVDPDIWNAADLDIRARYFDVADQLRLATGVKDINLDSPAQILKVLRDQGVEVSPGVLINGTNSKADLAPLENKYPIVRLLLEYRGLAKLLSSYGNGIPGKKKKKDQVYFLERVHPITGRIHSEFDPFGTATGRYNSSKPNVQQIPNMEKGTFRTACTGQTINGVKNLYIIADWSQFEMRILAYFSQDEALIKAFGMGGDLHAATAALMFDVPVETIVYKDPNTGKKVEGPNYWMRSAAKSINFGLVYGRGVGSLAAQLGVTKDRAKELMAQYFRTFSGAKKWLDHAARFGIMNGYQTTVTGRIRLFEFDPRNPKERASIERESKNTPVQGSNADMLKIALYKLHCILEEEFNDQIKIVNIIHDEINLEAPPELAEIASNLTKQIMEDVGNETLYPIPVVSEAEYGSDWSVK